MRIIRAIFTIISLAALYVSTAHAQTAPDPATEHFRAGDAANKAGDLLTTVIEWEATLQLKPTSTYTAEQLAAVKTKWTPDFDSARIIYDKLDALIAAKKFTDAEKQIQEIQKLLHTTPKCVATKLNDLYKAKRQAAPAEAPEPVTIIMRGEPQQQPGTYAIFSSQGIEVLSANFQAPKLTPAESRERIARLGELGPGRAAGIVKGPYSGDYCIAGRIKNTGAAAYSSVSLEISVINIKTGVKTGTTYRAYLQNVNPGDVIEWIADPNVESRPIQSYTAQVEKVTCIK